MCAYLAVGATGSDVVPFACVGIGLWHLALCNRCVSVCGWV